MILFVFVAAILVLLVLVFLLISGSRRSEKSSQTLDFDNLLPRHCQHFSHLAQVLGDEDEQFVARRASRTLTQEWKRQRRQILRKYLRGLHEDFLRLQHLARILAALSPEIDRRQEWNWLRMELQFRMLYLAVAVKILLGHLRADELAVIANLVGGLAAEMRSHISSVANPGASPLHADLEI